jgi:hypothetical protein
LKGNKLDNFENMASWIFRSLSGRRKESQTSGFYPTAASRHALPKDKLKKIRKRRAKNKMARKTHQRQRAAKK